MDYPKSDKPDNFLYKIVEVFSDVQMEIDSERHDSNNRMNSNRVLSWIQPGLEEIGFAVEKGKKIEDKIVVPVLFGMNGKVEKYFEADAYHEKEKWVIEVEAGRAYTNYQFLKDLFQACMMHDVLYLGIAVRNVYRGRDDFGKVINFFDTIYASGRLKLPLKGVLIIGY